MFKCCFPYKLFYQHNNFNQLLNADNIICNENVENVKQDFSHFGPQVDIEKDEERWRNFTTNNSFQWNGG